LFYLVTLKQGVQLMKRQDCTHTIEPRVQSALALSLALAWFALRRSHDGVARAAEGGLIWLERARQRRQMAELSDHMLRDIGLTRADAWAESDKPFWRP
jgi:uncharacterized protein YjiS (DUF1127 family)